MEIWRNEIKSGEARRGGRGKCNNAWPTQVATVKPQELSSETPIVDHAAAQRRIRLSAIIARAQRSATEHFLAVDDQALKALREVLSQVLH